MNDRLKVGVVGAGGIAQMMHLPTLAERPDLFEIAAVADVRSDVATAVGKRYGVATCVSDAREVFANPSVEAVLLLASGSQANNVKLALEAGKHVFVEKPIGFGLGEVEEVARVAKAHPDRVVMVGYHKRYDPVYRKARELVRGLKSLRYVEVTVLHPDDGAYRAHHAVLPITAPEAPQTEAEERKGLEAFVTGGPIAAQLGAIAGPSSDLRVMALMCTQSLVHDINLVRGTLGEPEGFVSSHVWHGGMAQSSIVRYPNDVRVNMSWIAVPGLKNYEETLKFVSPEARVELIFPSPYLRHLPTQLRVERIDADGGLVVENHTPTYEEAFRLELHAFRDHVRKGSKPETSVDDAVGDARFIEGMLKAARAGAA